MALTPPINLKKWIDDNRQYLKPPVGNKMIWNSKFMVMVVAGPNARNDFHVNPGEELFYQLEGDIVLRVMEDGVVKDIEIKEGELFLLPSNVPHSPQRPAGTIGLVVEHFRLPEQNDHVRWFCPKCREILHDDEFHLVDLGKQLKPLIEDFNASESKRTCRKCRNLFEPTVVKA
jgi:3-hydroxyanthranilate 3,4-dioxygenase